MRTLKAILANSVIMLVLVFVLVAPPVFSAVIIRIPIEKENLEIPRFVLFQNDKELNKHIEISKAREGVIWQVPVSYTVQSKTNTKELSVLTVVNVLEKATIFKIIPSSSRVTAVFGNTKKGEEFEVILLPKREADIDLLIDRSGLEGGETVEFILNVSATVVPTY